ncbi:hypothetical protein NX722_10180 [Endozoicomonas gorgoniicola]|uniref:Uncharacterized protein n=1 Tax=Endozoicomonas gorgoniicola TaxID=1234144 RepID=A0ABT3MUE0_9GAMM|nr:hypothetical protein [Endozoicomonas gorgoniicola]MCW7553001.1 hypothetical protein [Endozoicomonas gorgoniicola]
MISTDPLKRLLVHVDLPFFLDVLARSFSINLPVPEEKGIRKQKAAVLGALQNQDNEDVTALIQVVERVLLLCDGPGKDAMEAVRRESLPEPEKKHFQSLRNQYYRSLWLYEYDGQRLFLDALDKRDLKILRRSGRTCAGYEQPLNMPVTDSDSNIQALRSALSKALQCPADAIATEVLTRFAEDDSSRIDHYEVRVHYNLAPESIERVENNALVVSDILLAARAFVTYEPDNGALYVMSDDPSLWLPIAEAVSENLLGVPLSKKRLEVVTYNYQVLADPLFQPNLADLDIIDAKVTQLGVKGKHRSMTISSPMSDSDDIHAAAADLTESDAFCFGNRTVNKAAVTLKIQAIEPSEKNRTAVITLSGESRCSFRYSREVDKRICQNFLRLNGLIKRSTDDERTTKHGD